MTKIIQFQRRHLKIHRLFTLFQAEKNGGPVLRGQGDWRKINGFMINTRYGNVQVVFRRRGRA